MQNNQSNNPSYATTSLSATSQSARINRSVRCEDFSYFFGSAPQISTPRFVGGHDDDYTFDLLCDTHEILMRTILPNDYNFNICDAVNAIQQGETQQFHHASMFYAFKSFTEACERTSRQDMTFRLDVLISNLFPTPLEKDLVFENWPTHTYQMFYEFLLEFSSQFYFQSRNEEAIFHGFMRCLRREGFQFINENPIPPILVGIEPNPGPEISSLRAMQKFVDQNARLYTLNFNKFLARYDVLKMTYTLQVYAYMLLHDAPFRKIESKRSNIRKDVLVLIAFILIAPEDEPTLFARTDDGNLVGIETNPGPVVLSTPLSKSFKREGFVPQGLFNFGLDGNTAQVFEKFAESVGKIAENPSIFKVEHSAPLLDNLLGKVFEALPSFNTCKKFCLVLLAVAVFSYFADKGPVLRYISGFFLGYVTITYCDPFLTKTVNAVVSYVEGFVTPAEEDNGMQPQVGKEELLSAILGLIYYQSASLSYDKGTVTSFLKTVTDVPKTRDGISFLLDYVLETCQKFIDYVSDKGGFERIIVKESMYPEIDELNRSVHKLISELREGAPYNYDNAMILFELEKKANNVFASIPNTKEFSEYKRAAMNLNTLIKPLVSRMERNNITGNGPRREPLAVMLGGPSGVGKSTSIVPLILAVNSLVLPEEKLKNFLANHNDYIWNFIPENPFFDSYHGQFNTIIDEAGAQLDAAGTPDPGALGAIRMINTANFPLHMAHLEDKGNCNFNSELVWATTNRRHFDWKSMYLPEAYSRRFKLSYLHVPKKEYCKEGTVNEDIWSRRLDLSKIPYSDDGFVMSINEFYPYDFCSGVGKVTGPPIGFEEFVLLIAETYRSHKAHGDDLLDFHSKHKLRYVAMREKFHAQGPVDTIDLIAEHFSLKREFVKQCIDDAELVVSTKPEGLAAFWQVASAKLYSFLPLEKLESWFLSVKNFLCNNFYLVAVASVLSIAAVVWSFLRPIFFGQSGSIRQKRTRALRPSKVASVRVGSMPQSGISQNCIDISLKVMHNNVYTFDLQMKEGIVRFGYITFIAGRLAVMPEHFAFTIDDKIDAGECVENPILLLRRVGSPSVGFDIQYDDISMFHFDDCHNDVTFLSFPRVVHNHSDISKFICEDGDFPDKFEGALLRNISGVFTLVSTPVRVSGSVAYAGFSTEQSFTYPVATKFGECGAILISSGASGKPRICGMHIAGNGSQGMSTRFQIHHIKAALARVVIEVSPEIDMTPTSEAQVGSSFLAITEVPKLRTAMKNQVVPSPLHGAWGDSDYAPSALRSVRNGNEVLDPWANARSKYSCVSKAHNLFTLDAVTQQFCSELQYSKQDEPWSPRVFSFEEAVQGIESVPFCEGIPRNTSSGYPFCLDIKLKGKKDFFGSDGPYEFTSVKCVALISSVEEKIKVLSKGGRLNVMFADYLKDERRKKEKVLACKTRLISASPLDFLILCRMYFGDFVRFIMANRISNSCAIGVNPYSFEWEVLAQHMMSVGTTQIFGDFAGYDGSLCQTLEYKTLDVIENFYSNSAPEERQIRMGLFEDIINSRHVTVGPKHDVSTLYEWFGSNPSGNFLTTTLNSVCNVIATKYTIINIFAKDAGFTHLNVPDSFVTQLVSQFADNIRIITFGDDNGISVSDEFSKLVTQNSMTDAFSDIGFVYTDEAKTGKVLDHRVLQQCSFLKRGFVFDDCLKRHLAPLELGVILEMPYWTKTSAPDGSVQSTAETALMELSLHGENVFNKHAGIIQRACIQRMDFSPNANYRFNRAKAMTCDQFY